MRKLLLVWFLSSAALPSCLSLVYEESISDMLVQCNAHQSEVFSDNRTKHQCEKDNFSDNFSYVISGLETHYSKQNFWCFVFFKDDFFKLKFKLWFSHANYTVNAYGVRSIKPKDDRWESRIMFKTSVFVIVPDSKFELPEIFALELNGIEKCPLCGMKLEPSKSAALISGTANIVNWPWHANIYHIASESISFKCGGTLIQSKAVITSAYCVTDDGKKIGELRLQVGLGENQLMSGSGLRSNVFRTIVHQNFDNESSTNNIALLMLETQLKFSSRIMPICFPKLDNDFKGVGRVVGFSEDKNVLRDVEVAIVDENECYPNVNDDIFCAGEKGGLKNICKGDSGGGMYIKQDNIWKLKGITLNLQSCNEYATFTDVVKYLWWIDEAISSLI